MSSTIFEVLEYGPIVAGDEDMGYLVTINGSYLNLWSSILQSRTSVVVWNNIDCRSGHPDLYTLTVAKAKDLGDEWLAEILKGLDAEDESDTDTDEE